MAPFPTLSFSDFVSKGRRWKQASKTRGCHGPTAHQAQSGPMGYVLGEWVALVDETFPGLFETNYANPGRRAAAVHLRCPAAAAAPSCTFGAATSPDELAAPSPAPQARYSLRLRLGRGRSAPSPAPQARCSLRLRLGRGPTLAPQVLASLAASTSSMTTPRGAQQ